MTFELACYRLGAYAVPMAPARPERAIFDRNRHAYRCLPLSVANAAGWELLCPDGFSAEWDGGTSAESLKVYPDNPTAGTFFAKSHFAFGILTMEPGWLFRTSEGHGLWVMGSPNDPKDGIQALTGLVEADWLPFPFTVNWQFTRPGKVRFEKGEPFAFITPAQIGGIAACQPTLHELHENAQLAADLRAWTEDREAFMARLRAREEDALKSPWRRNYFRGQHPAGAVSDPPTRHFSKLRTKAPARPEAIPAQPPPSPFQPSLMTWDMAAGELRYSSDELQAAHGEIDETGQLAVGADTLVITCRADADAAGLDFLVVDDLVSPEVCAELCRVWRDHAAHFDRVSEDPFWLDRRLVFNDILREAPLAAALMGRALQAAVPQVSRFFKLSEPLYADVLDLVGWRSGMSMRVHADNCDPDGTPHHMSHRAYSGVLYLNDDYEGGGLYLPDQDVLVLPRAGMFVSLPAGLSHPHAVVRVERGTRVTMPFFLTFDSAKRHAAVEAARLDAQQLRELPSLLP